MSQISAQDRHGSSVETDVLFHRFEPLSFRTGPVRGAASLGPRFLVTSRRFYQAIYIYILCISISIYLGAVICRLCVQVSGDKLKRINSRSGRVKDTTSACSNLPLRLSM